MLPNGDRVIIRSDSIIMVILQHGISVFFFFFFGIFTIFSQKKYPGFRVCYSFYKSEKSQRKAMMN